MPNILFTFKIGDKEIDPSKFGEQFKEPAVEGAKDNLRAKIEAVQRFAAPFIIKTPRQSSEKPLEGDWTPRFRAAARTSSKK
jgi:hypothetical protein